MRFKFNKKIEFFLKKNFLSQSYLFEKRIKRSIKNNDEKELQLLKKIIIPETDTIDIGVYRGVYSYEMAKYSKMVHAFEPNPIIFKDIELNLGKIISIAVSLKTAATFSNKSVTGNSREKMGPQKAAPVSLNLTDVLEAHVSHTTHAAHAAHAAHIRHWSSRLIFRGICYHGFCCN